MHCHSEERSDEESAVLPGAGKQQIPRVARNDKKGRRSVIHSLQLIALFAVSFIFLGASDTTRFNRIGDRLTCVCGCNQLLLKCNHIGCQYSDNMRAELMAAVDRGDSDDLTLQAFVQKYGTAVIAAPTTTGFNRIAWIMPYLALVLGLTTVMLIVHAWKMRPLPAQPGDVPPVSGAELDHFREQARKETEE